MDEYNVNEATENIECNLLREILRSENVQKHKYPLLSNFICMYERLQENSKVQSLTNIVRW